MKYEWDMNFIMGEVKTVAPDQDQPNFATLRKQNPGSRSHHRGSLWTPGVWLQVRQESRQGAAIGSLGSASWLPLVAVGYPCPGRQVCGKCPVAKDTPRATARTPTDPYPVEEGITQWGPESK